MQFLQLKIRLYKMATDKIYDQSVIYSLHFFYNLYYKFGNNRILIRNFITKLIFVIALKL
jgi:hypothetical protein